MQTYVIAGITGEIGREFARRLQDKGRIYGISRKYSPLEGVRYKHIQADLLIPEQVQTAFDTIELTDTTTYIHLPGKFQYEDENYPIEDKDGDGIDDDTLKTNLQTFLEVKGNLVNWLTKNLQAKLRLVGIGSTSDLYNSPFWNSFTQAKNRLRKEFRAMYGNPKLHPRVSTLFINVSTVDGEQLADERPFHPKKHILTPREILDQSLPYILDERDSSVEISILKPNPDFNGFRKKSTKERWYREMCGS